LPQTVIVGLEPTRPLLAARSARPGNSRPGNGRSGVRSESGNRWQKSAPRDRREPVIEMRSRKPGARPAAH